MHIVGYPIRRYIYYTCPYCRESMKINLTDFQSDAAEVQCPWCGKTDVVSIMPPIGKKLSDIFDIEVEQVKFQDAQIYR